VGVLAQHFTAIPVERNGGRVHPPYKELRNLQKKRPASGAAKQYVEII
jgi:hypothetical protein